MIYNNPRLEILISCFKFRSEISLRKIITSTFTLVEKTGLWTEEIIIEIVIEIIEVRIIDWKYFRKLIQYLNNANYYLNRLS